MLGALILPFEPRDIEQSDAPIEVTTSPQRACLVEGLCSAPGLGSALHVLDVQAMHPGGTRVTLWASTGPVPVSFFELPPGATPRAIGPVQMSPGGSLIVRVGLVSPDPAIVWPDHATRAHFWAVGQLF